MTIGYGDAAQYLSNSQQTTRIKTNLNELAAALSRGTVDDITRHLGGDTRAFSGIGHEISQIDAYLQTASEIELRFAATQTALERIDGLREDTTAQLLKVSDLSSTLEVELAASSSVEAFTEMLSILNTRLIDRSLFSGSSTEALPFPDIDGIVADLTARISTVTTADEIRQQIDDWFADTTGGFRATHYAGSQGIETPLRVASDMSLSAAPKADHPAVLSLLKSAAVAAAAELHPSIDLFVRKGLLEEGGVMMTASGDAFANLRAKLGLSEERVAGAITQMEAKKTALAIQKNTLHQVDPFRAATELQAVELQLQTHFASMARLSSLTLLRYL
ncbi:flagellin [Yoonia litorea]|uniref:Flagellar hook-associated protein 3 FlgL n=1 Tax=Yoonia litorea TaxID=1123755 RepID=A0A1I6MUS6_9RHOB|nr:flagellin [Yoonia litorea]SFS19288.1 flagellar hook-associated protein 3 FlgL [Yoonia litorea]